MTAQLFPNADPGALLTAQQVIAAIPVSRETVYRWLHKGTFPAPVNRHLPGSKRFWKVEDIRKWAAGEFHPK